MKQGLKERYLYLIQKLNQLTDKIEYGTKPALVKLWEESLEVDVSIPDITTHEVQKIANYLARDLKVVSEYSLAAEEGIKTYWQRDKDYIAYKLLNILSKVEDPTMVEWHKLGLGAQDEPVVFRAGELTGLDALQCEHCGKILHFSEVSEIPVCSCGHRHYLQIR